VMPEPARCARQNAGYKSQPDHWFATGSQKCTYPRVRHMMLSRTGFIRDQVPWARKLRIHSSDPPRRVKSAPKTLYSPKSTKKHSNEDGQCRDRRGVSVIPVCHFFDNQICRRDLRASELLARNG
jgi:hypothetical protein